MTKDEFIDGYVKRSKLTNARTPDGFTLGESRYEAVICHCNAEGICTGWAMINVDETPEMYFESGQYERVK